MKATILRVLIVLLIRTFCLAAEETGNPSSIEGTIWVSTITDSPYPELIGERHYHAFHKGIVYVAGGQYILKYSAYYDLPQASVFFIIRQSQDPNPNKLVFGFLSNCGVGIACDGDNIFLLQKIGDNWVPPGVE